jgi:DnaK suppressor protein
MDPERARELLADERSRLEQAIAALGRDRHEADTQESEPGELGSQELLQSELEAGLAEDLAEQLAEEGTYGLSVDSREPIPDARLEAIPTAERTIEEQRARDGM